MQANKRILSSQIKKTDRVDEWEEEAKTLAEKAKAEKAKA